jgi:hypothetical protein
MNVLFTEFEVVAVGFAVLTIAMMAHDGETHRTEGVPMLAVYENSGSLCARIEPIRTTGGATTSGSFESARGRSLA